MLTTPRLRLGMVTPSAGAGRQLLMLPRPILAGRTTPISRRIAAKGRCRRRMQCTVFASEIDASRYRLLLYKYHFYNARLGHCHSPLDGLALRLIPHRPSAAPAHMIIGRLPFIWMTVPCAAGFRTPMPTKRRRVSARALAKIDADTCAPTRAAATPTAATPRLLAPAASIPAH